MAAVADGGHGGWQRVIEQLHTELLQAQGSILHLTDVLQSEQERSGAIESAAGADRARIVQLEKLLQEAKARDDLQTQAQHAGRKDQASTDTCLQEMHRRLEIHEARLSINDLQIADLAGRATEASRQIGDLESFARAARADLDAAMAASQQQQADLTSLREAADMLEVLTSELGDRHRDLSGAHDGTSSSLRSTIEHMIQPALDQAERERVRLDSADVMIRCLGAQGTQHCGRLTDLERTSTKLGAEQEATSDRLSMTMSSLADTTSGLARSVVEAKDERERLDDAWRNIEHLSQNAADAQTSLRKMQVEIEETQVSTEQQGALGHEAAEHLRALRHGLEVTDEEVQGIKALLEVNSAAY